MIQLVSILLCLVFPYLAAGNNIYFKNGNEMEAIDSARFFNSALHPCVYHDYVRQQVQAGHSVIELAEDQDGLRAILNYYRYGKLLQPANMSADQWRQILAHFRLQAAATGTQQRKFTFTLAVTNLKKRKSRQPYSFQIDYGNRIPHEVSPKFNAMVGELNSIHGVPLRQSGYSLIADNLEFKPLLMNQVGIYASLLPHWFEDYEIAIQTSEFTKNNDYFPTSAIMIVTIPYQSHTTVP
ncbi:hypothetical protein MIR68_003839 [Amoeboaphelidium protococcarum]|nr:hypothetical protein MIR68_003839 [Amoeboaphelidium protococcarum]